ncbi:heterodisulfide reductase subunit C [bacterium]|nr:MAG: heterodisulfide reductase subunit C [bacterium]
MSHHTTQHVQTIEDEIAEITGQHPSKCYQCGKCSAGCPIREYMEQAPNVIVRYIQLGLFDKALASSTIWLCAGCLTCSTRCPQNFDLAKFMDSVREIALRNGVKVKERALLKFHKAFLSQIKNHGRTYELGLVRDYKLATGDLFSDVDAAPDMFLKGKIGIFPHNIKGKDSIKRIFEKTGVKKCK